MTENGTLHESDGRYKLMFKRFLSQSPEEVFPVITDPDSFSQWYPFATGEMDVGLGGVISFNDGEGTAYEGIITELEKPNVFGFREVNDSISITLKEDGKGCVMTFTHSFNDDAWVVQTAAGWHRCLDVLVQIIYGEPVKWHENAAELRDMYRKAFKR